MITAWLWNSMIPEIRDTCIVLNTADETWDAINLFQSQRGCSSIRNIVDNSSDETRDQNSY